MIPDNARGTRITAAAGTSLATSYSEGNVNRLPPLQKMFTSRRTSSITRRRSVRLSSIAEDSRLQPPVGVWAVIVFSPITWGIRLYLHPQLLEEPTC